MNRDPAFERKPRGPESRVVDSIDFEHPKMAWLAGLAKGGDLMHESSDSRPQAHEQA